MITGSSVYDDIVSELMDRLKARGVLIIVIDGARNKSDIEFASALAPAMVPRVTECLDAVSSLLKADMLEIRRKEMGSE